jgi:hypothetical protein
MRGSLTMRLLRRHHVAVFTVLADPDSLPLERSER